MLSNTEGHIRTTRVRLTDDAYLAWFGAEVECENTHQAWFQATGERREAAYIDYLAALDREAAAARDLERLWHAASCDVSPAEETEGVVE
jgi:hypothetical protein